MGRKLGLVSLFVFVFVLVPSAVAGATELTIEKSDSADPVAVDGELSYKIVVENTTAGIASDVKVVDDPPDGIELSGEPPPDCIYVLGVVECEVSEVGFGGTFEIEFFVKPTEPGTFLNEATVETTESQNTANDTATETTTVLGPQHKLTVVKDGSGSGTVSSPLGISCGSDCSEDLDEGSSVTLTATPDAGSAFTGWGGDCAGSTGDICDLTMSAAKTARATFGPAPPAGPPTPSGPNAELTTPSSTVSWRELILLDGSKTTGASQLAFDLNQDQIYDFIVPASAPYVAVTAEKPGNSIITLTAISPSGATSTDFVPINITGGSFQTLSNNPHRGLPGVAIAGPSSSLVTQLTSARTCEARTHIYFYAVEASGCMSRIRTLDDIPDTERELVKEYKSSNFLTYEALQICPTSFTPAQCDRRLAELGQLPFYSRGTVKVNGMEITPREGASVVVFPALGRIVSKNATVNLKGGDLSIPVRSGRLNLDIRADTKYLAGGRQEVPIFSIDTRQGIPGIGSFPFSGEIKVSLVKENGRRFSDLSAWLALPEGFSSAVGGSPNGHITLEADNENGLILSKLLLEVKEALFGGLRLSNLSFTYLHHGEPAFSCPRKWWKATAEVFLIPTGGGQATGIKLAPEPPRNGVAFCAGGFHSAGGELQFGAAGPMIFPGVFLSSISFSMQLKNPTVLEGTVGVTAAKIVTATGALMSVLATPQHPYVVSAGDGNGTLRLLAGRKLTSTSVAIGGSVGLKLPADYVLGFGNGYMIYQYPDYISAGGELRVQTLAFTVEGGGGAEISATTGRFNANAHGKVCIIGGFEIEGISACIGGLAWVSTVGAVACFELPDDVWEPGIGYHWGDTLPEIYLGALGDGCKPSRYWERNVKAARAAAARYAGVSALESPFATPSAAPLAFRVHKGEDTKNVRLTGAGGAPAVTVHAPNGETLATVPNLARKGKRLRVLAAEEYDTTWIGVDKALPGTYTITPQPGSAPIAKMSETRPRADRLEASVSGRGDELTLAYDVGSSPGQVVTFFERGKATWAQIGAARRGKGKIGFRPSVGPAGKREIVAMVEVDGIPGAPQVLATFKAPSSAAGRVKGVRVTRRGKALRVSWTAARNAVGYAVQVERRDGVQRSFRVKAKRHGLRIKGIPATQGGAVKVAALGLLGDWGKPGAARFKALRKAPSRLLPYSQLGEGIESPTSKSLAGGR